MSKRVFLGIIEFIIILISFYGFLTPSFLIPEGYILSVDGVVIGRTMCLIFGLATVLKLSELLADAVLDAK